jgi:crossover junction endodeoxyribonuclease RuvC
MIVFGVDPGITGGIAAVEMRDGTPYLLDAMPTPVITAKSKQTVDARAFNTFMHEWQHDHDGPAIAVIENVHAMPKQGVSSSFQFGRMFGAVEACCYEMCSRVDYVEPGTWKRKMGLSSSKSASRHLASRLLGQEFGKLYWPRAKDEGVAEAALIAVYYLNLKK